MSEWVSTIIEIIKVTVPALIVFLTVYYLFRQYLTQQLQVKTLEFNHKQQATTVPIRLQAYERLSLFLERINIPGMILRVQQENMTAKELSLSLMIAVQKEYEHNITQQVYVSSQLWKIISLAKEDVLATIQRTSASVDNSASAKVLSKALLTDLAQKERRPQDIALEAIKKEASLILK
ncbi:MAG: hypothetical protein HKN16_04190 [Saprospiraceae bacterium]|nr:hypothetical protein [Saprospiraceae bacterium]